MYDTPHSYYREIDTDIGEGERMRCWTDISLKYHVGNKCELTGEYCYIPDVNGKRHVDCRNCNVPILMAIEGMKE